MCIKRNLKLGVATILKFSFIFLALSYTFVAVRLMSDVTKSLTPLPAVIARKTFVE